MCNLCFRAESVVQSYELNFAKNDLNLKNRLSNLVTLKLKLNKPTQIKSKNLKISARKNRKIYLKIFAGVFSGGATPDPIPNSAVKPASGNGIARATLWESSTMPAHYLTRRPQACGFFFLFIFKADSASNYIQLISHFYVRQKPDAMTMLCRSN